MTAANGSSAEGTGGLSSATIRDYLKNSSDTSGSSIQQAQQQQLLTPDFSALLMSATAATRSTPGSPSTFAGGLGFNSVRTSPILAPSLPQSPRNSGLQHQGLDINHGFGALAAFSQQQQQQLGFDTSANSAVQSATASPTTGAFNRRGLLSGMANLNVSQLPPTSITSTTAFIGNSLSGMFSNVSTAFANPSIGGANLAGVSAGGAIAATAGTANPLVGGVHQTNIVSRQPQLTPNVSAEFLQRVEETKAKGLRIELDGIASENAKSRVETQIKITLRLTSEDGERVTCWSHMSLPEMLVSREKFRHRLHKQSHTDGNLPLSPQHVVHLEASIICSSDPTRKVETCIGCIRREYKRSLRRKDNRLRSTAPSTCTTPAQSRPGSPTGDSPSNNRLMTGSMEADWDESRITVEKQRIVIFNCNDLLDFSKGELVLPTRITCYCRHHNEKVGFCICLTLKDAQGNVLATHMSPPIMITDDHKSTKFKTDRKTRGKAEYDRQGDGSAAYANHALAALGNPHGSTASLHLADGSAGGGFKGGRQAMSARNSPTMRPYNHHSLLETYSQFASLAGTPSLGNTPLGSPLLTAANLSGFDSPFHLPQAAAMAGNYQASAGPSLFGNLTGSPNTSHVSAAAAAAAAAVAAANQMKGGAATGLSPLSRANGATAQLMPQLANSSAEAIQISQLMPAQGPVAGGTSILITGRGFHPNIAVFFGNVQAGHVQVVSSSNIACTLPPTSASGPVVVRVKDMLTMTVYEANGTQALFTYVEDTDQALLELALQVVGLRQGGQQNKDAGENRTLAGQQPQASVILHDQAVLGVLRSLRLASEKRNLVDIENSLVKLFMTLVTKNQLDASRLSMRHEASGRTLLHFSALLGMLNLLTFLATHGVTLDATDNNAMTAMHFASMYGRSEIVELLLNSGASHVVKSSLGQTAGDLARSLGHAQIQLLIEERDGYMSFIKEDQVAEPISMAAKFNSGGGAGLTQAWGNGSGFTVNADGSVTQSQGASTSLAAAAAAAAAVATANGGFSAMTMPAMSAGLFAGNATSPQAPAAGQQQAFMFGGATTQDGGNSMAAGMLDSSGMFSQQSQASAATMAAMTNGFTQQPQQQQQQ
ncbi:hypothetical protein GQ54DRAFT_259401 [Martensiomyces pterosporus]|nr:hypothetical protein GQ54DRAFT_259401 [Martensiomyces pterosporus]